MSRNAGEDGIQSSEKGFTKAYRSTLLALGGGGTGCACVCVKCPYKGVT